MIINKQHIKIIIGFIFIIVMAFIVYYFEQKGKSINNKIEHINQEIKISDITISMDEVGNASDGTLKTIKMPSGNDKYYYIIKPDNIGNKKLPLVVLLHGQGERNFNYFQSFVSNSPLLKCIKNGNAFNDGKFIFVVPHMYYYEEGSGGSDNHITAKNFIDALISSEEYKNNINTNCIFLMGLSTGGSYVWSFVNSYPDFLAGAVPISSGGWTGDTSSFIKTPMWGIAGDKADQYGNDDSWRANVIRQSLQRIREAGGDVRMTHIKNCSHSESTEFFNNNSFKYYDTNEWDLNVEPGEYGKEIFKWIVNQNKSKDIAESTINLLPRESTYIYDGKEKKPTVVVELGEKILTKDTDYTIQYLNNKNAGKASAIITGIGNYTGLKEINFIINPRELNIIVDNKTITFGEDIPKLTYCWIGAVQGERPKVNGTLAILPPIDISEGKVSAGQYTISTINLTLEDNGSFKLRNYKIFFVNGKLTVEKAENSLEVIAKVGLIYTGEEIELVTTKNAKGEVYYNIGTELTNSNYQNKGNTNIPKGINTGVYQVYYYTPGNKNYEEKKGKTNAIILQRELVAIEVIQAPQKTSYTEGQNFDKTGMVVTAIYNNGSYKEGIDFTVLDGNNLTAGKTYVTISYTEGGVTKETTQTITVLVDKTIVIDDYDVKKYEDNIYIYNIQANTTINELMGKIETRGLVEIYKNNQKIEDETTKLETGMKVVIRFENEEKVIYIVVKGDINGDGQVKASDLSSLKQAILGKKVLEGAYKVAADINEDNFLKASDLSRLRRLIVGL